MPAFQPCPHKWRRKAGNITGDPCFYGIDMPTKGELIASSMEVSEIAETLGVDSLGYLSPEGMVEAVADGGPYCSACFSGEYPAPLIDVDKGFVSSEGPGH